ncbi:carbohydrate kinase family protein [Pseudodesulfovibrio piezophilus]|uniref:Putative fructokinase n=1 Tax=Pseudodesulfovibrio piezophilus (strain DSM 21447 / JCM 15486 / C1TLV30) TaxID=1322246 RepID=M1WMI1_PSEP2|nr:carbohydrate kinase [Pseudodesulfovibrio piezophilus]CCH49645.1 putative fructokinase [Pseudodesulfovibrio piezophilus C1TLV30]
MAPFCALGLGEILWDILPSGRKLGGAPANFAYHINALGGLGIPVSSIGDDDLGEETLEVLERSGLETSCISRHPFAPTGTVNAVIDAQGVATYLFPDNVAWDYLNFSTLTRHRATSADIICFGTLAQRSETSRTAITDLLRSAPQALRIFDINLRQNFYSPTLIQDSLALANVLKINDEELHILKAMFSLPTDETDALELLRAQYALELLVLTRGENGSLLMTEDALSDLPGVPTRVVDTIGAGDSFTAAVALASLHGHNLDTINRYATRVAAHVCGQSGAMPPIPKQLTITAL